MKREALALTIALLGAACGDPGWNYLVRRAGTELGAAEATGVDGAPQGSVPAGSRTWLLAGGQIQYSLEAYWFGADATLTANIRNGSSSKLFVRQDRARIVTTAGLAVAPSHAEASRVIVIPPGGSAVVRRRYGPLPPNSKVATLRFVDDGLELEGRQIEASFVLERIER